MNNAVRTVLFDLDDTLFDHRGCARAALTALRRMYRCFEARTQAGLEADYHRVLEETHRLVLAGTMTPEASRLERARQLLALSGAEPTDELAARVAATYHQAYLAAYRPVPGAVELLRALRGRVKIGIVTNNLVAMQVDKLNNCGMTELIDALVVSEEAGSTKPERAIFEAALERLGCRAEEAVMLGDAWATDIAGARGAGIRPIWLNRLALPCPDPAAAVAEIKSLEPVAAVLKLIFRDRPEWR